MDVLSAPTVDEMKLKRKDEMKQSKVNQLVKKAGETARRASAVTVDAIKVAQKQFKGLSSHTSLQIPETTLEAHNVAKLTSQMFVQEQKIILEKQLSLRNANRSELLVARQQRNLTRHHGLVNGERKVDKLKNNNRSRGSESNSEDL